MAILNPLYWHLSIDELNELGRIEWVKTLAEDEKKAEDKMRTFANNVIDIILSNYAKRKLKTVK